MISLFIHLFISSTSSRLHEANERKARPREKLGLLPRRQTRIPPWLRFPRSGSFARVPSRSGRFSYSFSSCFGLFARECLILFGIALYVICYSVSLLRCNFFPSFRTRGRFYYFTLSFTCLYHSFSHYALFARVLYSLLASRTSLGVSKCVPEAFMLKRPFSSTFLSVYFRAAC